MSAVASSSTTQNRDTQPARYALARSILGEDAFTRINTAKILVVGAGGIGCELLKNLVLTGFGNIEIIDLDTIDLSNLNRQFLFQKQHIKKPKSIVAKQTASSFNPLVNIVAHHANIKESRFGVAYFQGFDLVMNALDNLDARRWVNKMCIAANVPLIESGTMGFKGQVSIVRPGHTECYDCTAKDIPKSFPVCTIRSTPSQPIHCIVWGKSWLFTQLFGEDDETEDAELDKALADGENAQEIDSLRKEAREMRDIRASLVKAAQDGSQDALRSEAEKIFNKVYKNDIERLLSMEEMWTNRPVKPVPLVFQDAINGVPTATDSNGATSSSAPSANAAPKTTSHSLENASKLKDQQTLSLQDNAELFLSSVSALAKRAAADLSNPLSFDKDDDDALNFVTASSNLRSIVYQIDRKTRFEVKQMAGNIIPAIASTNAIISGLAVLQALHVLKKRWQKTRIVTLARGSARMLASVPIGKPDPHCGVCQDMYVPIEVASLEQVTLGQVLDTVAREALELGETELVLYHEARLLVDPDYEDNLEKSLADMGLQEGSILTVQDEDMELQSVNIVIAVASSSASESKAEAGPIRILATDLSNPKVRPPPRVDTSAKERADDSDPIIMIDADEYAAAKAKKDLAAAAGGAGEAVAGQKRSHPDDEASPEKKRKTQPAVVSDGLSASAAIDLDLDSD